MGGSFRFHQEHGTTRRQNVLPVVESFPVSVSFLAPPVEACAVLLEVQARPFGTLAAEACHQHWLRLWQNLQSAWLSASIELAPADLVRRPFRTG